jgi:hypothetical protein
VKDGVRLGFCRIALNMGGHAGCQSRARKAAGHGFSPSAPRPIQGRAHSFRGLLAGPGGRYG